MLPDTEENSYQLSTSTYVCSIILLPALLEIHIAGTSSRQPPLNPFTQVWPHTYALVIHVITTLPGTVPVHHGMMIATRGILQYSSAICHVLCTNYR